MLFNLFFYVNEIDFFVFMIGCFFVSYVPNMSGSQVDQRVLSELLQRRAPELATHFRHLNLFQEVITTSWFLALYTTTLAPQVFIIVCVRVCLIAHVFLRVCARVRMCVYVCMLRVCMCCMRVCVLLFVCTCVYFVNFCFFIFI